MSRYVKNIGEGKDVAYGFDIMEGYFFQVFEGVDEDGEEILSVNESSLFTNMSNGKMVELMHTHGVPDIHIESVAADLPF